jgi:dimethylamine/trimethylamine dehydrogenase
MADGKAVDGDRMVVYDADGYFAGVGLAEKLASEGRAVTLLSPFAKVAPYTEHTGEYRYIYRRLDELGVELVTDQVVTDIRPGWVTSEHAILSARYREWPADTVVLATQRVSSTALWTELGEMATRLQDEGVEHVYRVGDCVAPRTIADAVFDGHRLAREIDSDDPATHLPYLRENLVLEPLAAAEDRHVNTDAIVEATG